MARIGSVPAGTRVGRYEIVSLLGAGGMGEVYAALDPNLGRRVALKILPPHRTKDPDRVARFVREAHASSALNHPSIVSVHDAGSDGNVHFLAMELIDGEPLSDWLRKNRSLPRAIELMAQVAEGLDRAHVNGIIHRDLKPENIMVSRAGYAKIVDFGVAKLTERTNGNTAHTGATTPTSRVGTTAYMAPEQVEGRPLDARADVFAFGTVLYEVLTGTNPFASPRYADTLHNIAHLEPSLDTVPRELRKIVRRCLQKEPDQRYHSLKDAALDLREAVAESAPRRSHAWLVVAALLVPLLAIAAWFLVSRQRAERLPEMKMTRLTNSGNVETAAISPDGRYLVYAAKEGELQALYVKQIATGTTTRIAEPSPLFYYSLSVSPDGNYVYYVSSTRAEPNVGDLHSLPLLGGPARKVATDIEYWYSLSPDGTQVAFRRFNAFEREHRITIARVDGGGEEVVLRRRYPGFADMPTWTPDGKALTFAGGVEGKKDAGLYRLSLDSGNVTRVAKTKFPGIRSYAALPDGNGFVMTVYDREQPPQIWFAANGEDVGRKITNDIAAYHSVTPTADSKSFVAVRDVTDSNIYAAPVGGKTLTPVTTGIGNFVGTAGVRWLGNREILYTAMASGTPTLMVAGRDGGPARRLIHKAGAWHPSVSRDGRRIAFVSDKTGTNQVWVMDANGENVRQLTRATAAGGPTISPDGRFVYYLTQHDTQYVWRIDIEGRNQPERLTSVPTSRAVISPDGRWLLCRLRSSEPNVPLWRTALVPLDAKGPTRYFNAPRFGGSPNLQWHTSSESFLYIDWKDGIANIWSQPIDGGEPHPLTFFDAGEIFAFDLSPDGTTLALSRGLPSSDAVLIRDFR